MNLLHLIVTVLLNGLDLGCDYRLEESFNKKILLLALGNCSNINFISYTFPHLLHDVNQKNLQIFCMMAVYYRIKDFIHSLL